MEMILDLALIRQLSEERKRENLRFISYLKIQDSVHIDKLVHELNSFYISRIDCTQCGNCCTHLRPILAESDIDILIRNLQLSREKFKKAYVMTDEEGDMLFKKLPCAFLSDRKCGLYNSRPEDCRSYPHLYKNDFTSRLYGIFENYAICPIVFNVVEDLKNRLGFP
jgi:Fe-S-cluster containining protein